MTVQICSCEGLNPKCEKCFGSGYISSAPSKLVSNNPNENQSFQNSQLKQESFLSQKIESLSRKEIENIQIKLVANLDLKSKKQMQLLNSIPFNTTTFRRDFKDKFQSLENIEDEKQLLRNELRVITQEIVVKKYSNHLKFQHFLSDKDIDISSNRQLKDLIREYKKQKHKAGS